MNLLSTSTAARELIIDAIEKFNSPDPNFYNRKGTNEVQLLINSKTSFVHGEGFSVPVANATAYFSAAVKLDSNTVKPLINLSLLYAYGGYLAIATDYSYKAALLRDAPRVQFIHKCFSGGASDLQSLTVLADSLLDYKEEIVKVLALLYGLTVNGLGEKENIALERQILQGLVSEGLLKSEDESVWALVKSNSDSIP